MSLSVEQINKLESENNKLKHTLREIQHLTNHMINRCGQVVPYELKEIIKAIEKVK